MFILLLFSGGREKIDDTHFNEDTISMLKDCVTAFEQIKAMPHLGKLIEANVKKENAKVIIVCINDEVKKQKLIKEFQAIIEKYGSHEKFSFIPEYLLDFVKDLSQQYLYRKKKDAFKTGAISELINGIPNELSMHIASFLSGKDGQNLALVCKDINKKANEYVNDESLTKLEKVVSRLSEVSLSEAKVEQGCINYNVLQ